MPTPLRDLLDALARHRLADLVWSIGLPLLAALVGLLGASAIGAALRRWTKRTETTLDDRIVDRLLPPIRWLVPLALLRPTLALITLPEPVHDALAHACLIGLILAVGWLLNRVVSVTEQVVSARFDLAAPDNLRARAVYTQVRGFRNIARFVIGVLSLAAVLTTFDGVRQLGLSMLASAGVAGIVIGFAAQRSIATIVAGVQIALTQPIRVDDVVIVEGEWGRIEEITLTYVVVRIWDLRRLVVPITYFIERPFQNWTRVSADLMGTVFVHVDYTAPVDAIRTELQRIVEASEQWDGKVCSLLVTDAKERTLELRALVSAADAGKLWDLRCHVREALVAYLQREHPASLPLLRASVDPSQRQPTE